MSKEDRSRVERARLVTADRARPCSERCGKASVDEEVEAQEKEEKLKKRMRRRNWRKRWGRVGVGGGRGRAREAATLMQNHLRELALSAALSVYRSVGLLVALSGRRRRQCAVDPSGPVPLLFSRHLFGGRSVDEQCCQDRSRYRESYVTGSGGGASGSAVGGNERTERRGGVARTLYMTLAGLSLCRAVSLPLYLSPGLFVCSLVGRGRWRAPRKHSRLGLGAETSRKGGSGGNESNRHQATGAVEEQVKTQQEVGPVELAGAETGGRRRHYYIV